MPQWDFLDFLAARAKRLPTFRLYMNAEATDLLFDGERVVGARARTPSGPIEVRAHLTVGADGRRSTVREKAGLAVVNLGAPMDVLWMRLSRRPQDPEESMGRFEAGAIIVLIDRGDYWQCGFVIAKGGYAELQRRGLPAFRAEIARRVPFFEDRVETLASWEDVRLLTVAVDRLPKWSRAGLLCIGDAAHAMSPIGGVGVNLAIQDAVAAANILAAPLRAGAPGEELLAAVQRRREFPARATQAVQLFLQNRVIRSALAARGPMRGLPAPLRLLLRACPFLRRIPARLIGIGVRPEHVKTAAADDGSDAVE
jgi:2-polyprenyl-6-methoxyphenol hydroxylase-like FAD-dependent oxidoreductase